MIQWKQFLITFHTGFIPKNPSFFFIKVSLL